MTITLPDLPPITSENAHDVRLAQLHGLFAKLLIVASDLCQHAEHYTQYPTTPDGRGFVRRKPQQGFQPQTDGLF